MLRLRYFRRSAVVAVLLLVGCASRGETEVLEGRLRVREDMIRDLETQLENTRNELDISRSDSLALRDKLLTAGTQVIAAEHAEVLYGARSLKFSSMVTGGVDTDGLPGDEELCVQLMPLDGDNELIKLVGPIEIDVQDMSLPEDQRVIGRWEFTAEESRANWHRGFLSAGYLFQLPWQTVPKGEELTVHARLLAADGRQFDATTQVTIVPPGSISKRRPRDAGDSDLDFDSDEPVSGAAMIPVPEPDDLPPAPAADGDAAVGVAETDPATGKLADITANAAGPAAAASAAKKPSDSKPIQPVTMKIEARRSKPVTQSSAVQDKPVRTSDRFPIDDLPVVR